MMDNDRNIFNLLYMCIMEIGYCPVLLNLIIFMKFINFYEFNLLKIIINKLCHVYVTV